jgi:hypothetical protein
MKRFRSYRHGNSGIHAAKADLDDAHHAEAMGKIHLHIRRVIRQPVVELIDSNRGVLKLIQSWRSSDHDQRQYAQKPFGSCAVKIDLAS